MYSNVSVQVLKNYYENGAKMPNKTNLDHLKNTLEKRREKVAESDSEENDNECE